MEKMAVKLKRVDLPNGESIAYRERDGGVKNVLLIHGNMTSSKHWDVLMDQMGPEYKLYAMDLRGFGGSSYRKPITLIKDFSDDVKLFVDEIGLKNFALVGWSTGGAVGMQFAADYPGFCEKLVLLASASTRGYPFFGTSAEGLPDLNNRLVTYEEVKADTGKTIAVQTAYDEQNRQFLKAMWNMLIYTERQPEAAHYDEYVDDMLTQRNLAEVYHSLNRFNISDVDNGLGIGTDQVKDIQIPVLVLRGDRDQVVTSRMTEEIVEDFAGRAKFAALKNCGHSPLVDDLDQLLKHIEGFLAD